jgi:hypothetical protein
MTDDTNPKPSSHGDYERSDIGVAGVLYFLLGIAIFGLISHFIASGLFHYLQHRTEAEQAPVSPLVSNAPEDTRHLSTDYRDYLKQNFPSPQLEIDERTQLNSIITAQEVQLSTYDYVDKNAGTVRIPIDRAMDLIAQRGLPVRAQSAIEIVAPAPAAADKKPDSKKGSNKK